MINNTEFDLIGQMNKDIKDVLNEKIPSTLGLSEKEIGIIITTIFSMLYLDLLALTKKDPAAKGKSQFVYNTYSSFKAVMYYRIASCIYNFDELDADLRQQLARNISEEGKIQTKIEIHPASQIGKNFVIDHGVGTVIGETTIIGNDCYLLQGVILGSTGISGNLEGRRHPTIGDNVEIGAFAKILGFIHIGNNVFISPNCVITFDIEDNTRVIITNQLQLLKNKRSKSKKRLEIFGVIPALGNRLKIIGENFYDPQVFLLFEQDIKCDSEDIQIMEERLDTIFEEKNTIEIDLKRIKDKYSSIRNLESRSRLKIINNNSDNDVVIITDSLGLRKVLKS